MIENEKPLSDYISSVELVEVPVEEVQEEGKVAVKKEKSKIFPILVGILLFFIIGMGGYYIYNQYYKENLQTENIEQENEDDFIPTEEGETEEYVMKNSGWELVKYPLYKFSAELSPFTIEKNEYRSIDKDNLTKEEIPVKWSWVAEEKKEDEVFHINYYSNYLRTIQIAFLPKSTYDNLWDCGLGCAQEHVINIDIYNNLEKKELEEVKEKYFENLMVIDAENSLNTKITQSNEQKWGVETNKFNVTADIPDTLSNGYIVVNSDFVYIVTYYIDQYNQESLQIANRVLDSFEFGK